VNYAPVYFPLIPGCFIEPEKKKFPLGPSRSPRYLSNGKTKATAGVSQISPRLPDEKSKRRRLPEHQLRLSAIFDIAPSIWMNIQFDYQ
jgi:hypothetical protein